MLKVIKKFFAFCGKENRHKFIISVWLSVFQAVFEALKIPAIAAMIRALMRGNVETTAGQHHRSGTYQGKGHHAANRGRL